jgi:hypothetical protein
MFDSHSRDQLRQAYVDAWSKHCARRPLTPLEAAIADVVGLHPEYQALLQSAAGARGFQPTDPCAVNPFMHLGLHLAVREQLSIDRPPGICNLHRILAARHGGHGADHVLMEALEETLLDAHRSGRAPDETVYVERVRTRAAGGNAP